jgi:8-oxo-(d)GTP phosphatase
LEPLTRERELVRAAGGVVRRVEPEGIEVLLVHRPRYDDWTFPKGKAHPGEGDEETALREVEEETGIRARLGVELPSSRYRDSHGRPKVVRYWTMRPESGSFEPHREVDEIKWLPVGDAESQLSYERDVEVLRAVPPPLLVVRHASAGDSGEWYGDDARRPLDERGGNQAEALVSQLAGFELDRIVSSPFDRCVQTVEPLARARGLELETTDKLAEDAELERIRDLLLGLDGHAAMVCGHAPELEALFGKLKKGATVVVEPTENGLVELGRLPPPE